MRLEGDLQTITVLESNAVATADGRFAIALKTAEAGTIAFEVDEKAIKLLRASLDKIELLRRQVPGKA